MDRKVDMITAVVTSINAVLRNKLPMLFWAGLIVFALALGFVTAFLGLAVLLPLIGHATWHGYRETIKADAWFCDSCSPAQAASSSTVNSTNGRNRITLIIISP